MNLKKAGILGAGLGLALLAGAPAKADYTVSILDAPLATPTYSRVERWTSGSASGSNVWNDEVTGDAGQDSFRTGRIDLTWKYTAGVFTGLQFDIYTDYGLSGSLAGTTFVGFADLFIDVASDGELGSGSSVDWDYAIDIRDTQGLLADDGSSSNEARLVALSGGVSYQNSVQAFGSVAQAGAWVYGGRTVVSNTNTNSINDDNERPAEVKVVGATTPFDIDITRTGTNVTLPRAITPPADEVYNNQYTFTLTAANLDAAGDDYWQTLRVFWGTGWCSNDSIEGTAKVPVPAALPLVLAGFAGLGFVGFRQRRRVA